MAYLIHECPVSPLVDLMGIQKYQPRAQKHLNIETVKWSTVRLLVQKFHNVSAHLQSRCCLIIFSALS